MKLKRILVTTAVICAMFATTAYAENYSLWFGGTPRYGTFTFISEEELATLGQVEQAVQQFKNNYIRDDMSLFEKEMVIIDYLMVHVDYGDENVSKSHWAYGALVEGSAVCEGYAKAFMELAGACGIETKMIIGKTYEPHAWNLVKLDDGEWYHVDVTYADTGSFYGHYNHDRSAMRTADAHCTSIEGLGELWLTDINYPDGIIEFNHTWDRAQGPAANGYLYGPKVADEYFMNGVVDLSLAKPYEELRQIMDTNDNAHNRRSEEMLAEFDYVIPFTTWDETMEAAQAYLRSAPKENLRLAVKYENWEVYSKSKGDHEYIFAYELIKEPEQYGFGKFKIGEWYLTSGFINYEPFDEQNNYYDLFYSYKAGEQNPYLYNE